MSGVKKLIPSAFGEKTDQYVQIIFEYSHYSIIHRDYEDIMKECSKKYGAFYELRSDDFFYYEPSLSNLNTKAVLNDLGDLLEFVEDKDVLKDIVGRLEKS